MFEAVRRGEEHFRPSQKPFYLLPGVRVHDRGRSRFKVFLPGIIEEVVHKFRDLRPVFQLKDFRNVLRPSEVLVDPRKIIEVRASYRVRFFTDGEFGFFWENIAKFCFFHLVIKSVCTHTVKMKREKRLQMRLSKAEHSKLKWLADMYAKGSISKYVRYAIENAPRKMLK